MLLKTAFLCLAMGFCLGWIACSIFVVAKGGEDESTDSKS